VCVCVCVNDLSDALGVCWYVLACPVAEL
jgi:hypothetical protein